MSNPKIRARQEERLKEALGEITGSMIDVETLLGFVDSEFEADELVDATMIGHFLNNADRRIVNLVAEIDTIKYKLEKDIETV